MNENRARVIDYGIELPDGSWKLASGTAIVDDTGAVISSPTRDDILAQGHAAGTEWRTEALRSNPYATVPVDKIGVYFVDGQAVDYTVEVTDKDGTFHVWARNLDMALEAQSEAPHVSQMHVKAHGTGTYLHIKPFMLSHGTAQRDSQGNSARRRPSPPFRHTISTGETILRRAA